MEKLFQDSNAAWVAQWGGSASWQVMHDFADVKTLASHESQAQLASFGRISWCKTLQSSCTSGTWQVVLPSMG